MRSTAYYRKIFRLKHGSFKHVSFTDTFVPKATPCD